ncbi:MAG: bifunctional DNA primase/polymerase [Pseudomonadota bacterium]
MRALSQIPRRPAHSGMIELPDTHGMDMEEAAAAWASLGLRLCYENEDGERPVGKWRYADTKKRQLREPDTPERARFLVEHHNISKILIEPMPNMVVLDIDHRPAQGWDAIETGKALRRTFSLPTCPLVKTPSGGFHLWFQLPKGFTARNWTSQHGRFPITGVDVRTFGGLAAVPPSTRPSTSGRAGGAYEWVGDCRTLPMGTSALIEALTPPSPPVFEVARRKPFIGNIHPWIAAMLRGQLAEIENCRQGNRNAQLFKSSAWIAAYVAGGELPDKATRAALYNAADACGLVKEDGQHAVLATIQSGFATGAKTPRKRPVGVS